MRRTALLAIAIISLTLPAVAVASGWKIVKKKNVSGQFAVTGISATIRHPKKIAVDFIHGSGDIVWGCSKGFSVSSYTHNYGAGLHALSHVSGKTSCDVTASISGQGKLTVEILTAN